MIPGAPFPVSMEWADGLAATNAMTVGGITSSDNLLAVISVQDAATGLVVGRDITDYTVADGSITAGTHDLSATKVLVIWTSAPAS